MKCPHCHISFHDSVSFFYIGADRDGHWIIAKQDCPNCERIVLSLSKSTGTARRADGSLCPAGTLSQDLVHPKSIARSPVPSEVPPEIASDYLEACRVLCDSPKASAALSRRCLQLLLRSKAEVKKGDLVNEIQQVLDSRALPSSLAESIDAIRNIGNFSAHPQKSTTSGEILPVEPHEAEWTLDVLESLFDYYFVQPAQIARKRAALNDKLREAGKPPMK